MSVVTASFPVYHSTDVSFHAAVPAPALPEGMRALNMYELEYVSGGSWLSDLGSALCHAFCVGFAGLVSMVGGPIVGGMVGALMWDLVGTAFDS
jgi:hypothetical protein